MGLFILETMYNNNKHDTSNLEKKYNYALRRTFDESIQSKLLDWDLKLQLIEFKDIVSVQALYAVYKDMDDKISDMYFAYGSPE
jgi:DUF971 family protein